MRNRSSSSSSCTETQIPGKNGIDRNIILLSLCSAFVGIAAAILSVNFLEGEKVGTAGLVGFAIMARSLLLRHKTGLEYNGWILASSAFPFCTLLLPGGVILLSKRYSPQLNMNEYGIFSHDTIASTFPLKGTDNQLNLFALLSSTVAALVLITKLQRVTNREREDGN